MTTTSDRTKECRACHIVKPFDEYYRRKGGDGSKPGHYISECRECMRQRNKNYNPVPKQEPRAASEAVAIERLKRMGIHALPGKAVSAADVDVVAWGCVWIEVKYSTARKYDASGSPIFQFNLSPEQRRRGFLGHLLMLICDYGDRITYHICPADFPALYRKSWRKTGFTYMPGRQNDTASRIRSYDVAVLNDAWMTEHQDRYDLIEAQRLYIASTLGA